MFNSIVSFFRRSPTVYLYSLLKSLVKQNISSDAHYLSSQSNRLLRRDVEQCTDTVKRPLPDNVAAVVDTVTFVVQLPAGARRDHAVG